MTRSSAHFVHATSRPRFVAASALALLALSACSSSSGEASTTGSSSTTTAGSGGATAAGSGGAGGGGGGAAAGGGGSGGMGLPPVCTEPTEVPCSDQVIQEMNLKTKVTPGLISSEADGAGWLSTIDATAGGAFASDPTSYTYGRFTDTGLEKVDISDEQSLDAMNWDIAFRRYVVRINSGHSGPSCVRAGRAPGATTYEELTALPDALVLRSDDYFTKSCDIIPDGSGLPNSPATALSGYWTYPGCVKMTGHVFVIELASGRHVKLVVDDYYKPAVQDQCNTKGSVPMSNTGSATFRVRWAFLP